MATEIFENFLLEEGRNREREKKTEDYPGSKWQR